MNSARLSFALAALIALPVATLSQFQAGPTSANQGLPSVFHSMPTLDPSHLSARPVLTTPHSGQLVHSPTFEPRGDGLGAVHSSFGGSANRVTFVPPSSRFAGAFTSVRLNGHRYYVPADGSISSHSRAVSARRAVLGTTSHADIPTTSGWTAIEAPRPNLLPDPQVEMDAISCPQTGSCEAVGSYADTNGDAPALLLSQTAGSWQAVEAPLPPNASAPGYADLYAITCGSVGNCVAVGDYSETVTNTQYEGDSLPLVEVESSGVWSASTLPLPKGADKYPFAYLGTLACPAAGTCAAVGGYDVDGAERPLLALQNQTGWTAPKISLPKDQVKYADAFLDGISCWTASKCLAVGAYGGKYGEDALAVPIDGTRIKVKEVLDGKLATYFSNVECPAAARCTAVGTAYAENKVSTLGLASTFSGGKWKSTLTPLPVGVPVGGVTDRSFVDLECTGITSCVAIGAYEVENDFGGSEISPLLIEENAGHWYAPAVRGPAGDVLTQGELYSVACASTTSCTIAGYYSEGAKPIQPLVLTGIAGTWNPAQTALPAGSGSGYVDDVDCPASGACSAIGGDVDANGNSQPLAEGQQDASWSPETLATPANAGREQSLSLSGISCGAPGSCLSLGSNNDRQVVTETLSGGSWKDSILPPPAGANLVPSIYAESPDCIGPDFCAAAGGYLDNQGSISPLIVTENSGVWQSFTPTLPADAAAAYQDAQLNSISCWDATNCVAAGTYYDVNGDERGLLVTETNGTWGPALDAPVPLNAGTDPIYEINDVSCSSTHLCAATGAYIKGQNVLAVIDSDIDGHWSTLQAPVPSSANGKFIQYQVLGDIDCAGTNCIALGAFTDKHFAEHGLILSGDGAAWSSVPAPLPKKGDYPNGDFLLGGLADVACESPTQCAIVGAYANFSKSTPEIGPWIIMGHGTTWTPVKGLPSASADDPGYGLVAVSCTSDSCAAGGAFPGEESDVVPAIAALSSGKWTIGLAPQPAGAISLKGASYSYVNDIACPATGSCLGVGGYLDNNGIEEPLVEGQ